MRCSLKRFCRDVSSELCEGSSTESLVLHSTFFRKTKGVESSNRRIYLRERFVLEIRSRF